MMNTNNKILNILTSRYPYGDGETFVDNELKSLCENFEKVIIYPVKYNKAKENLPKREIPDNAQVNLINYSYNFKKLVKSNIITFFNLIALDIKLDILSRFNKLKHLKYQLGYFITAINIKKQLEKHLHNNNIYYSYWMNEGALALSMLKKDNIIDNFIFKCHRFDVYNETHPKGFIPFRSVNYNYADKVVTISGENKQYIEKFYPRVKQKLQLIYMGSDDYGYNKTKIKTKKIHIFSCSNMIPIKRVELIPRVLKHIKNLEIIWTHAGDGVTESKVKKECENLPENIQYKLLGRLTHNDIYEYYRINDVDLFLHFSISEGLPVSMMEAISFGVPIIACNAGGVKEIVTERTGVLLPIDFEEIEVADKICDFLSNNISQVNSNEIRKFWETHFYHNKNFIELLELLENL